MKSILILFINLTIYNSLVAKSNFVTRLKDNYTALNARTNYSRFVPQSFKKIEDFTIALSRAITNKGTYTSKDRTNPPVASKKHLYSNNVKKATIGDTFTNDQIHKVKIKDGFEVLRVKDQNMPPNTTLKLQPSGEYKITQNPSVPPKSTRNSLSINGQIPPTRPPRPSSLQSNSSLNSQPVRPKRPLNR